MKRLILQLILACLVHGELYSQVQHSTTMIDNKPNIMIDVTTKKIVAVQKNWSDVCALYRIGQNEDYAIAIDFDGNSFIVNNKLERASELYESIENHFPPTSLNNLIFSKKIDDKILYGIISIPSSDGQKVEELMPAEYDNLKYDLIQDKFIGKKDWQTHIITSDVNWISGSTWENQYLDIHTKHTGKDMIPIFKLFPNDYFAVNILSDSGEPKSIKHFLYSSKKDILNTSSSEIIWFFPKSEILLNEKGFLVYKDGSEERIQDIGHIENSETYYGVSVDPTAYNYWYSHSILVAKTIDEILFLDENATVILRIKSNASYKIIGNNIFYTNDGKSAFVFDMVNRRTSTTDISMFKQNKDVYSIFPQTSYPEIKPGINVTQRGEIFKNFLILRVSTEIYDKYNEIVNGIPENCAESREQYLIENLDVQKSGIDPWVHYQKWGKAEGRNWSACPKKSNEPSKLVSEKTQIESCSVGDCLNGLGLCYYIDGSSYKGEFLNGKRNGIGILSESDGNAIVGNWENDKLNGLGAEINYNEKREDAEFKYTGLFQKGKRFGYGFSINRRSEKSELYYDANGYQVVFSEYNAEHVKSRENFNKEMEKLNVSEDKGSQIEKEKNETNVKRDFSNCRLPFSTNVNAIQIKFIDNRHLCYCCNQNYCSYSLKDKGRSKSMEEVYYLYEVKANYVKQHKLSQVQIEELDGCFSNYLSKNYGTAMSDIVFGGGFAKLALINMVNQSMNLKRDVPLYNIESNFCKKCEQEARCN